MQGWDSRRRRRIRGREGGREGGEMCC